MTTRARRLAATLLVAVLAGCVPVTVNITFPQEKLDRAAGSIEDLVREGPATPSPGTAPGGSPAPGQPRSGLDRWLGWLAPREAEAQPREIQVAQGLRMDSPEIQQAIASRQRRAGQLEALAARGCIGESNQWTLEPRPGTGCGGEVGGLIGAENRDRQALLAALMKHNHIPPADAGRLRASFVKASRDRSPAGAWVQQDNGQWTRK